MYFGFGSEVKIDGALGGIEVQAPSKISEAASRVSGHSNYGWNRRCRPGRDRHMLEVSATEPAAARTTNAREVQVARPERL